jgi:putative addiction module CopG family antidote
MNVVLPPDLKNYVESLVKKGKYSRFSEVIEKAVRQHKMSRPGFDVVMTTTLEKLLQDGMAQPELASTTDELRRR